MAYRRFAMAAAFVAASLAGGTAALADVTVRMLHVEQNPDVIAYWNDIARRYEAANAGVKVEVQYLENEAYKKKLTTLLQSSDKPNIIYSWGGGVLRDQVKAGVIEDLTPVMDAAWKDRFVPAAVQAYTVDGKLYGVPMHTSQVGFFYNKDLFAKANVDAASIKTWDDLLATVKKLQEAGITPIITGGADKWPLHFYWSHLAMRVGGKDAFEAALKGEGKGFADTTFVKSGELFKQLVELKPFQAGFLGVTYPQSAGQFGDGKGAMMLMLDGTPKQHARQFRRQEGHPGRSSSGGSPSRPCKAGRAIPATRSAGSNGWLVTKGSPKEAAGFLKFFSEAQNQRVAAERGFYIPVVKGTQDAIEKPDPRQLAENVANSKCHQNFYDQMLGPSVGAVVNDIRRIGSRKNQARRGGSKRSRTLGNSQTDRSPRAGRPCLPAGPQRGESVATIHPRTAARPAPLVPGWWRRSAKPITGTAAVALLFLPPALLLFTLFVALPMGEAAWYSLYNWNGYGRRRNSSAGATSSCCSPTAPSGRARSITRCIIIVSLLVQLPLALAMAAAAGRSQSAATATFRLIFFLPYILAEVAAGLIWRFVFDGEYGPFRQVWGLFGAGRRYLLADPDFAIVRGPRRRWCGNISAST